MQLRAELEKVKLLQQQQQRILAEEEQASLVHLCLQLLMTEFAQHIPVASSATYNTCSATHSVLLCMVLNCLM